MIKTHGRSGYDRGCRCQVCVGANRDHQRVLRVRLRDKEPPKHGTNYAYIAYSCRCPKCTEAHNVRLREYKRRMEKEGRRR